MEPKKNPEVDIHKKRGVIFNFSLALSLLVVVCAFKVAVRINEKPRPPKTVVEDPPVIVPITFQKNEIRDHTTKPKTLISSAPQYKVATASIPGNEIPRFAPEEATTADTIVFVDEIPEVAPPYFIIVENMPEPVGGFANFFKTITNEMRYPALARRNDISGKVFIQFIINETGELTNFEVVKGIGGGCDEEAIRVLKLTKWTPGKQRGKPVKVKMIQQVSFKLARP
jgi:periplasmic protein TonB